MKHGDPYLVENITIKTEPNSTKTERISFRIDSLTLSGFEWLLSLNPNYNKSDILRDALHLWMLREMVNRDNPDGKIILMNQNILRELFELVDEQRLQKLIQLGIQNHEIGFKKVIARHVEGDLKTYLAQFKDLSGMLNLLNSFVYGSQGFAYFDTFEHMLDGSLLKISLTYQLGPKFGEFIQKLLEKHVAEFGYSFEEEEIHFNRSKQLTKHVLIFQKSESHLNSN